MSDNENMQYVKLRAKNVGVQVICIAIDSLFLIFWILIQYLVDTYVVSKLGLRGIDSWMLLGFQWLFAVSTLIPVIVNIYVDLRIVLQRAQTRIARETETEGEST